jgi:hypothetical protein
VVQRRPPCRLQLRAVSRQNEAIAFNSCLSVVATNGWPVVLRVEGYAAKARNGAAGANYGRRAGRATVRLTSTERWTSPSFRGYLPVEDDGTLTSS